MSNGQLLVERALSQTDPEPTVMSASDIDSAIAALSDAYSDVTVAVPRAAGSLRLSLQAVRLPNVRLGDLRISTATVRSACYPWYAVCLPISGRIRITSNGESAVVADRGGAVVSPGRPVSVEYGSDDCEMETLLFEPLAIERELGALLGHSASSPVDFDLQLPDVAGTAFHRALQLVQDELRSPMGLATVPTMAAGLGRLVIAGLLMSHRSNYSDELSRPAGVEGPRAIRSAVALIDRRPAEVETVADIAKAVGLSVRALDEGFRRHVGTSPMAYLRQVRLARAHDELVASDADVTTATVIAYNWGFWNYGRFAAAYRRRYGCTPSETLRATDY
jgi:AraC-like DNA-binding protein